MNVTILVLAFSGFLYGAVDFDALDNNSWVQVATGGESPGSGGDVHWAMDTAGYAYMFGGCTYYNGAGGTHNADMYRYNLKTGVADRIGVCGNNWGWTGGCQAGHAYDIRRNCVWYGNGFGGPCKSGGGGLMKFQCPNGPAARVNSSVYSHYLAYDPVNDLLYAPDGWDFRIYNCAANTWSKISPPFGHNTNVAVPCCVDTKRGLFVTTLGGAYSSSDPADHTLDVWFYDGSTGQWHSKTPPTRPNFFKAELAYDEANDKCVYFGESEDGCTSQVWVYDYDLNTWTRMPENSRAYNDANKQASTWPPGRHKHAWEYSPKYNAFFSWGGGQWIDNDNCTDYGDGSQPIWIYRLADPGSTYIADDKDYLKVNRESKITAWPNPFHSVTTISIRSKEVRSKEVKIKIFDVTGNLCFSASLLPASLEYTWSPHNQPPGIYLIKAKAGNRLFIKKVLLQK